jgi:translation initiation factor 3 subunit C
MTDLHANPVKEILAQGVTTKFDAEEEFLKFERSNQIPDHLHIAPDLLDAVHVLSAMIMEIPYIAANDRRHVINRNFRRLWENYNKQPFNGPPDTTRDCAMAASKALSNGFWKKAVDYVNRMKFWGLIAKDPSIVKTRLESAIKEVALKSYLIRYGRQYTAISLDRLVVMFSMPSDRVHRIVSHMMIKEELDGAWDQTTKCIIMNASEPNALQQSSLQFSDKICLLSEQHEKILEQRGGVLIAAKDQKGKQGKLPKKGIRPVRPVGAKKSTEAVALKAR